MNYHKSYLTRKSILYILIVAFGLTLISCDSKIPSIPVSDISNLPSVTVKDFETIFTDSGRIQLTLSSPLLEQYDNTVNPYDEFKRGILVLFYDGKDKPVGSVAAKYAKYLKPDNTWELKDSVVVINEKNEILETEVLYWDQDADRIYTDRFVKISSEDQIIQGSGLEADSRLNHRVIKKVWARIYVNDEK